MSKSFYFHEVHFINFFLVLLMFFVFCAKNIFHFYVLFIQKQLLPLYKPEFSLEVCDLKCSPISRCLLLL